MLGPEQQKAPLKKHAKRFVANFPAPWAGRKTSLNGGGATVKHLSWCSKNISLLRWYLLFACAQLSSCSCLKDPSSDPGLQLHAELLRGIDRLLVPALDEWFPNDCQQCLVQGNDMKWIEIPKSVEAVHHFESKTHQQKHQEWRNKKLQAAILLANRPTPKPHWSTGFWGKKNPMVQILVSVS